MSCGIVWCVKVFTLRLEDSLAARVDGVRGDVPRSVWVRRAVERALASDSVAESSARVHRDLREARLDEMSDEDRERFIREYPVPLSRGEWERREGRPMSDEEIAARLPEVSRRVAERALSEAKEQASLGSVSSSEGVGPAAPAEQPLSRSEMFKRATQR